MWKLIALALPLTLAAAPSSETCAALATKTFKLEAATDIVTLHSATHVEAKANLPEHCDVRGVIWPEAKFAIKLPIAWNDRFQMVGNGGTAGASYSTSPISPYTTPPCSPNS